MSDETKTQAGPTVANDKQQRLPRGSARSVLDSIDFSLWCLRMRLSYVPMAVVRVYEWDEPLDLGSWWFGGAVR